MTSSPTRPCGCPDYDEARLALSRRALLGTALAGGAVALGPSLTGTGPSAYAVTGRSAAGLAAPGGSVLVILSLRGAADGLSLVVPHADPVYYAARPRLAIPQDLAAGTGRDVRAAPRPRAPAADVGRRHAGRRARHRPGRRPTARTSRPWRSIEDADPGSSRAQSAGSTACSATRTGTSPLQGIGDGQPARADRALRRPAGLIVVGPVDDVPARRATDEDGPPASASSWQTLWRGAARCAAGRRMRRVSRPSTTSAPVRGPPPANRAAYPATRTSAQALSDVARIDPRRRRRRGDHRRPGRLGHAHRRRARSSAGDMSRNAGDLASSIAAFFADLGGRPSKVTLVTLSEFGRRVAENDDYGLDHGFGNVMFVAGAGVQGGRYYGSWPGLSDTAGRRPPGHHRLPQRARRGRHPTLRRLGRAGLPGLHPAGRRRDGLTVSPSLQAVRRPARGGARRRRRSSPGC